jgi:vacuolar-type H+-ATPase catalytic subunit A/Vma1
MSCILQGVLDALFLSVLGGTCALLGAFEYWKTVISQALSKVIVCHWWVIYPYTAFVEGNHEVYLGCIFFLNSQYCDHS